LFNEGCAGSIAPLIGLMVDQNKNFALIGVSVEFVGKAQDGVLKGEVQLVYLAQRIS